MRLSYQGIVWGCNWNHKQDLQNEVEMYIYSEILDDNFTINIKGKTQFS